MSKITIENYRGIDIEFDSDYGKFQCIATDGKEKDSKSFDAVKKYIDDYKKANQNFEPFNVVGEPETFKSGQKLKIVGVRKDGRFIGEDEEGSAVHISKYDESDYMIYKESNNDIIKEYCKLELDADLFRVEHVKKRKAILSRLDIVSLKDTRPTLFNETDG